MKKIVSFLLVIGLALVLAACGSKEEGSSNGSDANSGSKEEIPETLVLGFVPSVDSDTIADTVEPLAERLSEELGIKVEGKVMTSFNALVEAMGANQVQVGFVPAFGYVQANEQYGVEVILKSERYGSGTYKAQYLVRSDSGIKDLADLEGKIWAYPDQGSTSGYLFPANQLMEEFDIASTTELETEFFSGTTQAGGHDNAAIAVYEGDADVATTFEDVREDLLEEYPDIMEKLTVIGYTQDIPNDTISVTKNLPDEFVQKIKDTFLSFNDDPAMIKIMNDVYNWDAITEATDSEYQVVKDTYNKFKDSISIE
ncbi:phosphate/phosphite/phosphonate ABC transporter substrate-binding protein [Caldibacillus lycopersici]|uniref:Phosphate/phosphite/phosphonate ABC transporter substrate-binding protein n=1 Tax=Perspicuibacillus lycopersici TaxID=1325689 RepID=A0AAE3LPB1_9BACI|nr:phosphate/phosphite/phosphonate ABC transporter substrate-binding protein [Perspicuibacillus lycopersici]MCU9614757.1 phosphate/phosphite/phosphonate ABC transporter substrate-binding protein [Perspicuibacillus lycopersici]